MQAKSDSEDLPFSQEHPEVHVSTFMNSLGSDKSDAANTSSSFGDSGEDENTISGTLAQQHELGPAPSQSVTQCAVEDFASGIFCDPWETDEPLEFRNIQLIPYLDMKPARKEMRRNKQTAL